MGTEVRTDKRLLCRYSRYIAVGAGFCTSRIISAIALAFVLTSGVGLQAQATTAPAQEARPLSRIDNDLLDDISRRSFRYFWQNTDPRTGLILDRARFDGRPEEESWRKNVASIAATGFGLTAYCIAAQHRWISPDRARNRVLTAVRFFAYHAQQKHGWFYHFLDAITGKG